MTRKVVILIAAVVLAVCLLSGGCLKTDNTISDWKELLNIPVTQNTKLSDNMEAERKTTPEFDLNRQETMQTISLSLYFGNSAGTGLEAEQRDIHKTEGIARRTMEELLKGPVNNEYINVFPEGTRLLDINVKPDGMCIIDMSREVTHVSNYQQEKLMVYAIVNTLSQFASIESVRFRVEGQEVETLGGYIHLGNSVKPDLQV